MVRRESWLNGKARIMWVEQLFKSLMAHRYYKLMLDTACMYFPSIPRHVVTLQTNELDVCEGHFVDITAEIWDDVIALLNVLQVARRTEATSPVPLPLDARAPSLPASDNQSAPSQVVNKQGAKKQKGKNKNKQITEQNSSYASQIFYKCFQYS